ncbi:MAG: ATP-binding protein [Thermodesulfobacteriota bacterium]|nr:ATP-binding protein [Thermodesulfobacteriota bacterium]
MSGLKNKYGPYVSGDDFFDRDAEVRLLTSLIDEGNNTLIVAPRRVGKTSLVRETFRRMEERKQDYLLYADIQHCSTPEDVVVAVSMVAYPHQALRDRVLGVFSAFLRQCRDNVESVGSGELLEIKFREGLAGGDWQVKGRNILQGLARSDKPIALCFDELPVMISRLLSARNKTEYESKRRDADLFLSWLRQVMESYKPRLRFIICGSIGIEPILKRHGLSHTITQIRPFYLEPWSRETAEDCLNVLAENYQMTWNDEAQNSLLESLGSYVPHHVQMFFGHLWADCIKRKTNSIFRADVLRIYETSMLSTRGHAELADYEERLFRVLDPGSVILALDLLTEAAVAGGLTPENSRLLTQSAQVERPDEALRVIMDVLQHDGYLEWDEDRKIWSFVSSLVKDWWKKRFSQSHIAPEERR